MARGAVGSSRKEFTEHPPSGNSNPVGVTLAKRNPVGQERARNTCTWGHESDACESCVYHRLLKITRKCHTQLTKFSKDVVTFTSGVKQTG